MDWFRIQHEEPLLGIAHTCVRRFEFSLTVSFDSSCVFLSPLYILTMAKKTSLLSQGLIAFSWSILLFFLGSYLITETWTWGLVMTTRLQTWGLVMTARLQRLTIVCTRAASLKVQQWQGRAAVTVHGRSRKAHR